MTPRDPRTLSDEDLDEALGALGASAGARPVSSAQQILARAAGVAPPPRVAGVPAWKLGGLVAAALAVGFVAGSLWQTRGEPGQDLAPGASPAALEGGGVDHVAPQYGAAPGGAENAASQHGTTSDRTELAAPRQDAHSRVRGEGPTAQATAVEAGAGEAGAGEAGAGEAGAGEAGAGAPRAAAEPRALGSGSARSGEPGSEAAGSGGAPVLSAEAGSADPALADPALADPALADPSVPQPSFTDPSFEDPLGAELLALDEPSARAPAAPRALEATLPPATGSAHRLSLGVGAQGALVDGAGQGPQAGVALGAAYSARLRPEQRRSPLLGAGLELDLLTHSEGTRPVAFASGSAGVSWELGELRLDAGLGLSAAALGTPREGLGAPRPGTEPPRPGQPERRVVPLVGPELAASFGPATGLRLRVATSLRVAPAGPAGEEARLWPSFVVGVALPVGGREG